MENATLKTLGAAAALALGLSLFAAPPAGGQVEQVEMNIDGYLCGF